MREFSTYVTELRRLARDYASTPDRDQLSDRVAAALDGEPSRRLRELVGLEERRADGAFFTGSNLASRTIAPIVDQLDETSRIYDPACGSGDLLLACAAHLPVEATLGKTLRLWTRCLAGRDLHGRFISAAKYRLALLAARRGVEAPVLVDASNHLGKLRVGRGDTDKRALRSATHLILNPPFKQVVAPEACEWKNGRVNSAALFLEDCLRNVRNGTRVIAILPDVLRSGDLYADWRELVGGLCRWNRIEVFGRFDASVDVDVFILDGERVPSVVRPRRSWSRTARGSPTVADHFDISVGSVVDYRDPRKGPWMAFATPRCLPPWETVRIVEGRRRTTHAGVAPPFVAVRRTSNPKDGVRAVATIIVGEQHVTVENHLLVLRPKDSTLRSCRQLLAVLRDPRTTRWLNARIRCRHLTVSAMSELPWRPARRQS